MFCLFVGAAASRSTRCPSRGAGSARVWPCKPQRRAARYGACGVKWGAWRLVCSPDSARSTAQRPRSRKRPSSSSARSRCTWLSSTCRRRGGWVMVGGVGWVGGWGGISQRPWLLCLLVEPPSIGWPSSESHCRRGRFWAAPPARPTGQPVPSPCHAVLLPAAPPPSRPPMPQRCSPAARWAAAPAGACRRRRAAATGRRRSAAPRRKERACTPQRHRQTASLAAAGGRAERGGVSLPSLEAAGGRSSERRSATAAAAATRRPAPRLQQARLRRHVPRLPHRVLMRGRQTRVTDGSAVRGAHDAFRQQEVPEQRRHQQVLRHKGGGSRKRVCGLGTPARRPGAPLQARAASHPIASPASHPAAGNRM
jgi:hypothetical protein